MKQVKKLREPEQLSFDIDLLIRKSTRMMSVDELFSGLSSIPLVELQEDRRIERKIASVSPKSLADYYSIFANTPPDGGIILIGVENNGQISGCLSTNQNHLNDLERAGDNYCPEARYECQTIHVRNKNGDEDTVLAMRVNYRHDKVVETSHGDAFIRRGESTPKTK